MIFGVKFRWAVLAVYISGTAARSCVWWNNKVWHDVTLNITNKWASVARNHWLTARWHPCHDPSSTQAWSWTTILIAIVTVTCRWLSLAANEESVGYGSGSGKKFSTTIPLESIEAVSLWWSPGTLYQQIKIFCLVLLQIQTSFQEITIEPLWTLIPQSPSNDKRSKICLCNPPPLSLYIQVKYGIKSQAFAELAKTLLSERERILPWCCMTIRWVAVLVPSVCVWCKL